MNRQRTRNTRIIGVIDMRRYELEQAVLEYSDRVLFPGIQKMLLDFKEQELEKREGQNHKGKPLPIFTTDTQLSGMFHQSQAIQKGKDIFYKNGNETNETSFEAFLSHRQTLAEKRNHKQEQRYWETLIKALFGDEEIGLNPSIKTILTSFYDKEKAPSQEREQGLLLLFREWNKHVYYLARRLSQSE
ncbi:hypothetical protein WDW89_12675 [Deltaproteobacteria bacterium TL4]